MLRTRGRCSKKNYMGRTYPPRSLAQDHEFDQPHPKLHGLELPTSRAQDHIKLYQRSSQHHSTSWKAAKAWQMVGKDVKCGIRVTFLRHFVGPANQI